MASTDIVQRTSESIVAVLDRAPAIVSLTSRAARNVRPFTEVLDDMAGDGEPTLPVVGYMFVAAEYVPMAPGDWRRLTYQFTTAAATLAESHALCEAIEDTLTSLALANATPTCNAYVESRTRRGREPDESASILGVDLEVVLVVQK